LALEDGSTCILETSVLNHLTPRNNPEYGRNQPLRKPFDQAFEISDLVSRSKEQSFNFNQQFVLL
jgi:hypothetical protein